MAEDINVVGMFVILATWTWLASISSRNTHRWLCVDGLPRDLQRRNRPRRLVEDGPQCEQFSG